jgi:hypothetical protein
LRRGCLVSSRISVMPAMLPRAGRAHIGAESGPGDRTLVRWTRSPLSDLAYGRSVSSNFPADILELQVAEYGPDARVVPVVGEIDAVTAPDLATSTSGDFHFRWLRAPRRQGPPAPTTRRTKGEDF